MRAVRAVGARCVPYVTQHETLMPRLGLWRFALPLTLAGGVVGCSKPPVSMSGTGKERAGAAADPWEPVARLARKEPTPAVARTALSQLTNDLAARPESRPPATAPDDLAKLTRLVPLAQNEAAEVAPAGYTGLDAVHLADALYLQAAARSLDPGGLPPPELARLAFDWVCRQVYLQPWGATAETFVAVPPTAALRRGWGVGLERAYVFLALLQQLGLDGCLVGPPDAAEQPARSGPVVAGAPRGPFWAAGVLVGNDILLFDPWAARPVPGPGGKGVATLAQVRADPALAKDVAGGTAGDAAKAAVALAVPVSALSRRMAVLEEKLKTDVGVRLADDPAALQGRFAGPAGGPPRFWHPPGDPFSYGRVAATFTPAAEGGADLSPDPNRGIRSMYTLSLFPQSVLALPAGLEGEPAERLRQQSVVEYGVAFVAPPGGELGPRERIQRGHFQDANRYLTLQLDTFGRGLDRLREAERADPDEVRRWVGQANEMYADLRRARFPDRLRDRDPRPDSDPDVARAKQAVDDFWRQSSAAVRNVLDRGVAGLGQSEAAFLLALSKHEEAERKGARSGRGGEAGRDAARAAWAEAAHAWDGFLDRPAARQLPARLDHAKGLAARAAELAGQK